MIYNADPTLTESLQLLCSHLLSSGSNDSTISNGHPSHSEGTNERHFQNAFRLLSSSIVGQSDLDESQLIDKIKRRLVKHKRESDAVRFADLCIKLQGSKSLQNRRALLQFLQSLSLQNSRNAQPASFVLRSSSSSKEKVVTFSKSRVVQSENAPSEPRISSVTSMGNQQASVRGSSRIPRSISESIEKLQSNITNAVSSFSLQSNSALQQQMTDQVAARRDVVTVSQGPMLKLEQALIRDLIFVMQGIDGQILRRNPVHREQAQAFIVDPTANVPKAMQEMVLKLAECGWLYQRVKDFADTGSTPRQPGGLFLQGFCSQLNNELTEYYRLLAVLRAQQDQSMDQRSANTQAMDSGSLTLRRLMLWTWQPRQRLSLLAALVDVCADLKGGALLSMLYSYSHHGDEDVRATVRRLLTSSCQPLHTLLVKWLYDGYLDDPYDEFFISADSSVSEADFWQRKYFIRDAMLPSFFTREQANMILLSGKSINFLRYVCKDRRIITAIEELKRTLRDVDASFLFADERQLHRVIDRAHREAGGCLLSVMKTQFFLLKHLDALRKYMLLTQGDFARQLMELLQYDLSLPADQLYMHNLTSTLDTALRQTTAQCEPKEILDRIDIKTIDPSAGDRGWDVFKLEYHVTGPVSTVFNPAVMTQYSRLFVFIWRVKRLDFLLGEVWRLHMTHARIVLKVAPELRSLFHKSYLLGCEMMHFVEQIQYYFNEALELSWSGMMRDIVKAADLDDVIRAHSSFVDNVARRTLLDKQAVRQHLRNMFDLICDFYATQAKFYAEAAQEADARHKETGSGGTWNAKQLARRKRFGEAMKSEYRPRLDIMGTQFRNSVQDFLLGLTSDAVVDSQLRWLSFRLDYSQFYSRLEPRLEISLSYRRQSQNYFSLVG